MVKWAKIVSGCADEGCAGEGEDPGYDDAFSPQIQRTACQPRVAPTPQTAPPMAWVVEIGT